MEGKVGEEKAPQASAIIPHTSARYAEYKRPKEYCAARNLLMQNIILGKRF